MRNLLFFIIVSITASSFAFAEDSQSFIGAWELVKFEEDNDKGEWVDRAPEGTKFVGSIMYSASGKMQAQLHLSDRTHEKLKSNFPEFVDGYVAYFADYSINDQTKVVTHKRLGHINAESIRDVQRSYIFDDDLLILTPLPQGNMRLTWKRVKP